MANEPQVLSIKKPPSPTLSSRRHPLHGDEAIDSPIVVMTEGDVTTESEVHPVSPRCRLTFGYVVGLVLIALVAVIWVAASAIVQVKR